MGIIVKEDDPLTWFQGAPSTSTSSAPDSKAAPASGSSVKESDPLTWFPSKTTATTQQPPTDQSAPVAVGDTLVAPDDVARINAPPSNPPITSLEDLRARIQQTEQSILNPLRTPSDAGLLEGAGRTAAAVGVHALSGLAQLPVNVLIGLGQGAGAGNLTIDPTTNAVRLTPEASTVSTFATNPLRFSGDMPLVREPPSPLTLTKPLPVTVDELTAAISRADRQPVPAAAEVSSQSQPETVPPEHAAWVTDTKDRVAQVLKENAAAGGPDSLSAAATPPADAKLSPAKAKAYRRVSELNQVLSPIEGEDTTAYVNGSTPTLAERVGVPETSQQEVMLRQRNPNAFDAQMKANNTARVKLYDDQVISDVQAADLKEAQQEAAKRDGQAIAEQAGPVDASEMAAWAKDRLADPRIQENPEVYNVIKDLHDRLYDADGNLKTDPRAFWGIHDRLQNMLQKAKDPLSASSNEKFAAGQINDFKQLNDAALDRASSGAFRTFLDNQANFLKQENAYNLLSKFRARMTDKNGNIIPNRFHQFVTDLAVRRGKPGIDPAMDVPDEVMQNLINIDQDLKRASRIDLGKARGSPTNLFFALSRAMGIGAAHLATAASSHFHGGMGNVLLQQGIKSTEEKLGNWRINRLSRRHLEPPPGGLTPAPGNYRNPLSD